MRIAMSVLVGLLVVASQPSLSDTAQQEKMKSCNTEATSKQLKGDERKAYMKTCLSASGSAASTKQLTPQQQKMSDCSKEAKAKNLSGDARKQFMSTCLKG
jgi:hypothetical protein